MSSRLQLFIFLWPLPLQASFSGDEKSLFLLSQHQQLPGIPLLVQKRRFQPWHGRQQSIYFILPLIIVISALASLARLVEARRAKKMEYTESLKDIGKIHSVVRFGIIIHIHNESRERIVSSRRRLSYQFTKISVTSCDQRLRTKGILVYRCCCC